MIILGCACVAVCTWVARRARVGARARGLAGVRLGIVERAVANRRALAHAAVGALAGGVAAGWGGAAAGVGATVLWRRVQASRARAGRARRLEEQIPDALRSVASALRAGRNLPQAIAAARDEAEQPARAALDAAVRRLDVGAPIDVALRAFAVAAGSPTADAAAETIAVGRRAGANLPRILDVAVASMAERARIERDRRAATAQARLSAVVVGAMPAIFVVMVGPGARDQLLATLQDPIGWLLLGGGLLLDAGGTLWMRAMTRAA